MKLQLRVYLWLALTLVVIGSIGGIGAIYLERETSRNYFEKMAETLAFTVRGALEHDMLERNPGHIQDAITRIKEGELVNEVAIFSSTGKVIASGRPDEVGTVREEGEKEIKEVLRTGEKLFRTEITAGENELCAIVPVPNKAECQGCHGTQAKILGAIEVGLVIAPLEATLRQHSFTIAGLGFLSLFSLGIVLTIVFRRNVMRPLSSLVASAQRIASGDYGARVETPRGDEMGTLGHAFNQMAERIEAHGKHLEDRVRERTEELSVLLGTSRALASSLSVDALFQTVMEKVQGIVGPVGAGILFLAESQTGKLVSRCCFGCDKDYRGGLNISPGESLIGKVFQADKPLFYLTPQEVAEANGDISPENRLHLQELSPSLAQPQNAVGIPLLTRSGNMGCLVLFGVGHPDEADGQLLQGLGDQIAVAVENARLYEEVQQMAHLRRQLLEKVVLTQEEERRRISRELHDETGQALIAIMLELARSTEALPRGQTETRERLSHMRQLAAQALSDLRKTISALRPEVLDDLGLVPALRSFARERLESQGIEVRFRSRGSQQRLPAIVEMTLFRAVQEAIVNIARHSQATAAEISLEISEQAIKVSVQDNGVGFDMDRATQQREALGLRGIVERVTMVRGSVRIDSKPGVGTHLHIEVPLRTKVDE